MDGSTKLNNMRYFISDLHFYHESLLTKMDRRGFSSIEEMHDYMIRQWNGKVRASDEVVILGDVSMERGKLTKEILAKLNGRLFLVKGNHDNYLKDRLFDSSRFEWVREYTELRDNKRKIVLCHYPVFCYNGQYRTDSDGNPRTYMLYGHVHDTFDEILVNRFINETAQAVRPRTDGQGGGRIPCQMINCFCMFSDYVPLSLEEWIKVDRQRRDRMNGR